VARNLLDIATAAVDEMGSVARPTALAGSSDEGAQQLLALLNREGKELSERQGLNGGWPVLRRLHTITTVADQANYAFPSDISYFINTTAWDRTQKWPLRGPVSPQEWQIIKSGTIGSIGPRRRFRIYNGEIYFDPTPESSGDEYIIEYYSNEWCEDSGGTGQTEWASDTDVPRLPDDCFILGLIWRFKKAKGLAYAEDYAAYMKECDRELGRSGMAPIIDLTGERVGTRFLDESNIPDSFPDLV